MSNIESVTSTGPDTTHWVVKGPLGAKVEFDAKTTQDEPNSAIGWNTVDGQVQTSGQVRFQEVTPNRTRVEVQMNYADPPGGKVGEVASRAAVNPKVMMEQDLRNSKDTMAGKPTPQAAARRAPARGGRVGEVASRAVVNPKVMMEQDLRNFKDIMEGKATPEEVQQHPSAATAQRGGGGRPTPGAGPRGG